MDKEERPPDMGAEESRHLLDRSSFRLRRARDSIASSQERIDRTHHRWHTIAVGRVCEICKTAQVKGEFDDNVPCEPKAS